MARKKALKNRIKELFSSKTLKSFLAKFKQMSFYAIFYGLPINYSLFGVFGVPFKIYTFPAYGILLYFLKSEFIYIVRWSFHRIPGVEE